ncbi:GD10674 [Drosophila simulans]|uniref:GD10674 n=1 Tax=Drosophila simulans TaxID=7240 RepID=B4QHP3_DROSI|nr:GD10674 [Drosophila simulans]
MYIIDIVYLICAASSPKLSAVPLGLTVGAQLSPSRRGIANFGYGSGYYGTTSRTVGLWNCGTVWTSRLRGEVTHSLMTVVGAAGAIYSYAGRTERKISHVVAITRPEQLVTVTLN